MNKLLLLTAAAVLGTASIASAQGRTVCVLRHRPVAIQPAPRPVVYHVRRALPMHNVSRPVSYYGYSYGYSRRVPVVYGHINPRLHYVNPCLPNGYVGGLRNLPSNVIQIPHTFGRSAPMSHAGHGHSGHGGHAAPAARGGK